MNPRVKSVSPNSDYTLTIEFLNDEIRVFDVKPYLKKGIFRELCNIELFNAVFVSLGTVTWKNGQDLCPDTLYENSQLKKAG